MKKQPKQDWLVKSIINESTIVKARNGKPTLIVKKKDFKILAQAIRAKIVERLPEEEVTTMYEGIKYEPRHYRMMGFNEALKQVKEKLL